MYKGKKRMNKARSYKQQDSLDGVCSSARVLLAGFDSLTPGD